MLDANEYLAEFFVKTTIASGTSYDIAITTGPAAVVYKPTTIVASADSITAALYEGGTVTGGETVTIAEHNRTASKETGFSAKKGVTVSNLPTLPISQAFLPGSTGVGQTRAGGNYGGGSDFILKPNTTYIYRILNGSSGENTVQVNFLLYEIDEE